MLSQTIFVFANLFRNHRNYFRENRFPLASINHRREESCFSSFKLETIDSCCCTRQQKPFWCFVDNDRISFRRSFFDSLHEEKLGRFFFGSRISLFIPTFSLRNSFSYSRLKITFSSSVYREFYREKLVLIQIKLADRCNTRKFNREKSHRILFNPSLSQKSWTNNIHWV